MALADYIVEKPVIDAPRLRLRPLRPDDVPALEEWMADKSLYAYWGKGPGKTDRQPALLFARPAKPSKSFHLGIEEKSTGKAVGDLWVYRIENDRTATVAIRLAPSRQGRGFGTEALAAMTRFCFDRTELRHLRAEVDVRNTPSRRMLEKCGYRQEGPVRHGKMVSVQCDYCVYGIQTKPRKPRYLSPTKKAQKGSVPFVLFPYPANPTETGSVPFFALWEGVQKVAG